MRAVRETRSLHEHAHKARCVLPHTSDRGGGDGSRVRIKHHGAVVRDHMGSVARWEGR